MNLIPTHGSHTRSRHLVGGSMFLTWEDSRTDSLLVGESAMPSWSRPSVDTSAELIGLGNDLLRCAGVLRFSSSEKLSPLLDASESL